MRVWSWRFVARGRVGGRAGRQGVGLHRHGGHAEPRQRERGERAAGGRHRRWLHGRHDADAAQINAANLATYRAVVFVNSAGDVLDAAQETDLTNYVNGGGGFVGIGETAKLEEGNAAFDTLLGLTGNPRTTAASATSIQDVEFLDRVHPATRDLAALARNRNDNYFQWTNNPTGQVHTVARVRFNTIPTADGTGRIRDQRRRPAPDGQRATRCSRSSSARCRGAVTCSRVARSTPAWARPSAAYDDSLNKHLASAVQWAAGMVRGNCKATINSNYTHTRLTPANPTYPNQPMDSSTANFNPFMGEIDALAMAEDGRIFYAGRAVCFAGQQQFTQWTHPTTGLGCGPIHVYDPRGAGLDRPEPVADRQGRRPHGARCQGRRHRDRRRRPRPSRASSASRWTRTSPGPAVPVRRLSPVLRRRDGPQHRREHGPGLRPRGLHGRAPALALHLQRDDADDHARLGADHPPLHDPGLLLLPPRRLDGLGLAGQPVLRHRRQHGQQPELDQRRLHQRAPTHTCRARAATPTSRTSRRAAASTRPIRTVPGRCRHARHVRRRRHQDRRWARWPGAATSATPTRARPPATRTRSRASCCASSPTRR